MNWKWDTEKGAQYAMVDDPAQPGRRHCFAIVQRFPDYWLASVFETPTSYKIVLQAEAPSWQSGRAQCNAKMREQMDIGGE